MGTVFSIDIRNPGCDPDALDNAIRWLHWADNTFSTYTPDSQISRLARDEIDIADCAPEVSEILTQCEQLQAETDGYFSAYATGRLDPSGLVKGWAIQRVSDMLRSAGSLNHCVNGGGDVYCAGTASDGEPWRVGIADPRRPGCLAGVVVGIDIAVATSGTAERGTHLINPHTGTRPPGLASVTIIGTDVGRTDAYATAAFVMGRKAGGWIETLNGYRDLIIRADGTTWSSTSFAAAS